jgi:serine protease Do
LKLLPYAAFGGSAQLEPQSHEQNKRATETRLRGWCRDLAPPSDTGNSGGALVDLQGRLIGINSAILSPAGGNIGIGFAVPINMARRLMEQIVLTGRVNRGRIGISIQDLTRDESAAAAPSEGAVITEVGRGSPAEQAGIQKGDMVVAADGAPIRSAAQLRNKIGLTPVGQRIELTIARNGVSHSVSVDVAPAGDSPAVGSRRQ